MKFKEWYKKDGINHERCEGLTPDERTIAEKAWNACKIQCADVLKSYIAKSPDYEQERTNWTIEDIVDDIGTDV